MTSRLRGIKKLIHDAVDVTTRLVDEGSESTSRAVIGAFDRIEPGLSDRARAVDEIRRITTRGVLATVRGVNRVVEKITDAGLDAAENAGFLKEAGTAVPLRSSAIAEASGISDAALGVINGAIGDRLHATGNGLGLGMHLRFGDVYLNLDDADSTRAELGRASPRAALFVHGLMTTEWSWCLESARYHGDPNASFGSFLERDLNVSPIWARYNSGRHVSENGRELARAIQKMVDAYPHLEELNVFGHSMGGLVVRSACHYAEEEGMSWITKVKRCFCLGSPHHGAPLESVGRLATKLLTSIDTAGTLIPGMILEARSAGIKDLGNGKLVDEDWLDRDPDAITDGPNRQIPFLDHVAYYFISATITKDESSPVSYLLGDLLVRVPSASGKKDKHVDFPIQLHGFGGIMHHQMQNHPAVYEVVKKAMTPDDPAVEPLAPLDKGKLAPAELEIAPTTEPESAARGESVSGVEGAGVQAAGETDSVVE